MDLLDLGVHEGRLLDEGLDLEVGVYDGRVVPIPELLSDGGEGVRGQLTREVDRDVASLGDLLPPARPFEVVELQVVAAGDLVLDRGNGERVPPAFLREDLLQALLRERYALQLCVGHRPDQGSL